MSRGELGREVGREIRERRILGRYCRCRSKEKGALGGESTRAAAGRSGARRARAAYGGETRGASERGVRLEEAGRGTVGAEGATARATWRAWEEGAA